MSRARHVLYLVALVVVAFTPGLLHADPPPDDEAAAFARERLIELARDAVRPADPGAGGLDDIRKATQRDREAFGEELAGVFKAMDELVGRAVNGDGPVTEGLIQQGSRLYRWVTGGLSLEEAGWKDIEVVKKDGEEPKKDGDEAPPAKDDKPGEEPKPVETKRVFTYAKLPPFLAVTDEGEVVLGPHVDPGPTDRSLTDPQRVALTAGALKVGTRDMGAAGAVITLEGIGELVPWAGLEPNRKNPRFPLVAPDELSSPVGANYVAWRKVQLNLRRSRWGGEQPKGLVSDAEVEQKGRRAERARAHVVWLTERRREIYARFDRLDRGERDWTREAGASGHEIEELQRKCADCPEAEKARLQRELERANVKDRRAQLELRLLYVTVLRAAERLARISELEGIAKEEVILTQTVHQRFQDAANLSRRSRQLKSLAYQERTLGDDLEQARQRLDAAAPDARAPIESEIALFEDMRAATLDTRRLVELRRALEQRAAPPATEPSRAADPAAPPPESNETEEADDEDPLRSVRDPAGRWLDEGYIQLVRERLSHPEFRAALVAEHYEAADRAASSLRDALPRTEGLEAQTERFNERMERITKILDEPTAYYWPRARARVALKQTRSIFEETLHGIEAIRGRITQRLQAIDAWRKELLGLGLRSFQIRVDRSLSIDELGAALDDAGATKERAQAWILLESDPNALHFLVSHWLGLLAALGLAVLSLFVVRIARRGIDRSLERAAERIPHLRAQPVTVTKEAEERREAEVAAATARGEAEADAINKAAGDAEALGREVRGSAGGDS